MQWFDVPDIVRITPSNDERKPFSARSLTRGKPTPEEIVMRRALTVVGNVRNAFMLRGITCLRDENGLSIRLGTRDKNGKRKPVLYLPSDISEKEVEDLLHEHVTKVLVTLRYEHHPKAQEMWDIDEDFLRRAETMARMRKDTTKRERLADLAENRDLAGSLA